MARFLDHHTMPAMSAEQMKKINRANQSHDRFEKAG